MESQERAASRTAMGVALLRAMHQLCDASPKIISDPIIPLLVDDALMQRAKASPDWLLAPMTTAMRSHVVLRTRYAEDCLHRAALRGVRQYVILGSGFETFAYRQPSWAETMRIFEVDHAASQRAKIERLRSCGVPLPANLEFVAADFESQSLQEALSASSLDCNAPAFFSCLGVLIYLPEESSRVIFRLVASFPKGSELVVTFSQGPSGDDQASGLATLARDVAAVGEPWRTYHDPDALCQQLQESGFSQVSLLSPQQAKDLYYRDRPDQLPPPRRASIARAIV